ncbi:SGNH/GDSL hydrolase family protein [Anaerolineae bacterium CFX9]|nr:SGNH/GDSL hydrolase family protein [Anaerolineae bacterium CFX9]
MLAILVLIAAVGVALTLGAWQKRSRALRVVSINLLITYGVIVLLLGGAEVYFRTAYAESDGLPTLALENWLARYWQTNSLGYRDREWTPEVYAGRRTILAVGDSFTAGWGIADPADRWTDRLAALLGEGSALINLGDPGAATPRALQHLQDYPLQTPDVVIWQYYLNDIDDAALSIGLDPGLNPLEGMPSWAQESYLGNFVYWRLANPQMRGTSTYIEWLFSMFDHSVVWEIHARQLNAVIDQVEAMGADLIVVIFPDMLRPADSIPYVDRVAQVFEARGYGDAVTKLFDAAEAMPLLERIVSPRDAHPSAAFSALVAQMLYEQHFAGDAA